MPSYTNLLLYWMVYFTSLAFYCSLNCMKRRPSQSGNSTNGGPAANVKSSTTSTTSVNTAAPLNSTASGLPKPRGKNSCFADTGLADQWKLKETCCTHENSDGSKTELDSTNEINPLAKGPHKRNCDKNNCVKKTSAEKIRAPGQSNAKKSKKKNKSLAITIKTQVTKYENSVYNPTVTQANSVHEIEIDKTLSTDKDKSGDTTSGRRRPKPKTITTTVTKVITPTKQRPQCADENSVSMEGPKTQTQTITKSTMM